MKFSEKWLRTWVQPEVDTDALVAQLTAAGLEVDSVERLGGSIHSVVVGHVLSAEQHPSADRLRVCQVDVGDGMPREIVCGAANVAADQKVPVALVGGVLPGGMKIRKAKLRGIVSQGMICSAAELALEEDSDGILVLDDDAQIGTAIGEVLDLDDVVIEVDLTPNRGDCLSLAGIAREVGVLNRAPVTGSAVARVPAVCEDSFPVQIDAPADCPRYAGRVIRNVNINARTPRWMLDRLARSGMRGISPAVDVTNYVMMELGQPMHAFDLERLHGAVHVRRAHDGERLVVLDGTELSLDHDALVIADEQRALALAGIMGGEASGVADDTRHLFLESAFFSPTPLAGQARRFGLHTDSSHRFERGVDPTAQATAIERATALVLEIMGGEPGPVVVVEHADELPAQVEVALRPEQITRLIGMPVAPAHVEDILTRLDFSLRRDNDSGAWRVRPPPRRFDVSIEADLIEEIARIVGYDNVPMHRPRAPLWISARDEEQVPLNLIRDVFVARGYFEAITYSFVDPQLQSAFSAPEQAVSLSNPIASDMAQMRTSLWTGLLKACAHNLNRQQAVVRLFEMGLAFVQHDSLRQVPRVAALVCGAAAPMQWGAPANQVDFFDIKGDLESLMALTGNREAFEFRAQAHQGLHPGRCACVVRAGEPVGWIGMVHPRVAELHGISAPVYVFEVDRAVLVQRRLPQFAALSKFPAVRRDIAVVVDAGISAASVLDCVGHSAGDVLKNLELFDVYRGEGIDPGKKSLALALTFQADSNTLADHEIDTVMERIVADLGVRLNGGLRG